tara:strand:+ start:1098 stop:1628 length:531 start_codon:yes stop_codon:yes gene_type:complete
MRELYLLGYAKGGKELEVMDQLDRFGISFWRGERIKFERRGKNRTAEPFTYPALPNYIFMQPDITQLEDIHKVKYLAKRIEYITPAERMDIRRFQKQVAEAMAEAQRIVGNREAMSEYNQGDTIEIKSGRLAGRFATFEVELKRYHDPYAKIRATVDMMGRATPVELDPLDVRRVG